MSSPELHSLRGVRGTTIDAVRIGPVTVYVGESAGKYPQGNHVVVRGSDATVSFDMPFVSRELPERERRADLVVLSHVHEDHTVGLDLLPHAPVHVHAGDLDAVRSIDGLARHYGYGDAVNRAACRRAVDDFHFRPRPDAIGFDDGATWDLGGVRVRAVHAPGHTSGHCILLVEPHGIAFIADIDLSTFGPYYGDATSSLPDFRASLRLLRGLDAGCWVTSHHKGIVSDRGQFLALLDTFGSALDRREQAVLAALRDRPQSVADLVRTRFVYPPGHDDIWVDDVERRTIRQHLDALVLAGQVRSDGELYTAI